MSLASQVTLLAQAIGAVTKVLRTSIGTLASLTTTDKTSLVAALNEVKAGAGGGTSPVYSRCTVIDVTNNIAKTALAVVPIPANELGTTGCLDINLDGDFLNTATARTLTFEIVYGTTVMYADVTGSLVTNAARRPWRLNIRLAAANSATSQVLTGELYMGTAGATTGIGDAATVPTATTGISAVVGGVATEDSTGAKNLTVNVTVGGTAVSTFSCRSNYVTAIHPGAGAQGATGATGSTGAGTNALPVKTVSTATYTLAAADDGYLIECTFAGAITVTCPQNSAVAITAGAFSCLLVATDAAGVLTIVAGSGATTKPTTITSRAPDCMLAIIKTLTNTFRIGGDSA